MDHIRPFAVFCLMLAWILPGCVPSDSPTRPVSTQTGGVVRRPQPARGIDRPGQGVARQNDGDKQPGEIRVLLIGNSHTAPIPKILTGIFKRQQPDTKTSIRSAPSFGFLVDHANVPATVELIRSGQWDFVILQAQKYSSSGKYTYPTDGAEKLCKIANDSGAQILLFPEWSRADVPDEYPRIKAIHNLIAEKTGADVAPVGEAWVVAASRIERTRLYAADGNHASPAGSYLTACVFYSMITNQSPVRAENSESEHAESTLFPESHRLLEQAAWSAVESEKK